MKLIIDRDKWIRGETEERSRLLRSSDGKMCCLGFYSKANGYSDDEIEGINSPCELDPSHRPPGMNWLFQSSTPGAFPSRDASTVCWDLMVSNDDSEITEDSREKCLSELFEKNGVEVEFVGGA